jgi:hypothetical protein
MRPLITTITTVTLQLLATSAFANVRWINPPHFSDNGAFNVDAKGVVGVPIGQAMDAASDYEHFAQKFKNSISAVRTRPNHDGTMTVWMTNVVSLGVLGKSYPSYCTKVTRGMNKITWKYTRCNGLGEDTGDITALEGFLTFMPTKDGKGTQVTYHLASTPSATGLTRAGAAYFVSGQTEPQLTEFFNALCDGQPATRGAAVAQAQSGARPAVAAP